MALLEYIREIISQYRNKSLVQSDVEKEVVRRIENGDIDAALELFQNRSDEVTEAIKEYNPITHAIMSRPNKPRKGQRPYITEKLARTRQKYINEVELFFIFGKPVTFSKVSGDDTAYDLFTAFLKSSRFDSKMRQIKRLAGSETECAKLYHLYNDGGKIGVKTVVLARSTGYDIRPLFNQYGDLVAFAYGYKTKFGAKAYRQHWNIETPRTIYEADEENGVWHIADRPNPTGRINVIYYRQPKAWDGVQSRIEREEMLDSKKADTNNYFADPVAKASADVIESLASPETTGKLIEMHGSQSVFDYVQPPQSSELRRDEQENLEKSILFDTFTPDFSFDNMRGMGTVSGSAIKNSMILGFLKADNRKEIYSELIDRDINLMKAILGYQNSHLQKAFDELDISFDYSEPFSVDENDQKRFIMDVHSAGLISTETAVALMALTPKSADELQAIKKEKADEAERQMQQQMQQQLLKQPNTTTGGANSGQGASRQTPPEQQTNPSAETPEMTGKSA